MPYIKNKTSKQAYMTSLHLSHKNIKQYSSALNRTEDKIKQNIVLKNPEGSIRRHKHLKYRNKCNHYTG